MVRKKSSTKKQVKKSVEKKQEKYYNNILKVFFILFGVIFLIIIAYYGISYTITNFTYDGISFKMVEEGGLIFYSTAVPIMFEGDNAEYNFYLRNDPRELLVDFEGVLRFKENMVLNSTGDFKCEGDGIIAIANMVNLYKILGTEVIRDENATCDENGEYVFIQIQEGNETKIEQFGPACYNMEVNNCEILEVTERFMIETFSSINKVI
jgi:hypothetical protein